MPDNANPAPGAAGGNGNGNGDVLLPYAPIVLQPNANFTPAADAAAVPVFYGDAKVDAGEASAWLQQVGRNCIMCGHNARQAINFAVQRLGGPARDWYYTVALQSPRDFDARRMEEDFEYWQEKFLLRYAGLRSSKDPVRSLEGLTQKPYESTERFIIRLQAAYADFDRQSRQRTLRAHEATPNTEFIHVEEQEEIEDLGLNAANTQRVLNICMKGARRFAKKWIDEKAEDSRYEAIATHAVQHCNSERMKTLIRKKMFDPDCNTPSKLADACREEDLSHTAPVSKPGANDRSFLTYGQDGNKGVSSAAGAEEEDPGAVEALGQAGRTRTRSRSRPRTRRPRRGRRSWRSHGGWRSLQVFPLVHLLRSLGSRHRGVPLLRSRERTAQGHSRQEARRQVGGPAAPRRRLGGRRR